MNAELIDDLRDILGADGVLEADTDLSHYEAGWRYGRGRALAVARPRRTAEVAALAELAAGRGLRLKPQGANTGLVGASNPDESGEQLVVSFERFAASIEIDPVARTARVDAGVSLSALNAAAAEHGLFFPIDLGADPQIGGMIATNTGGTRLIRYGSVREHLLGLEVVLPDGRVWSELSALRKDNRGPDLRALFVGSSGQYGFITRAVLSLEPRPRQVATAWAALTNAEGVLDLLAHLERELGGALSAFEVLSAEAFAATLRHGANLSDPFGGSQPPRAVLVELSTTIGREHLDLEAAMMASFEAFLEKNEDQLIDVTPQSPADAWNIRHQISESLRHEGQVLALDVSLPRQHMPAFQARVAAWLGENHPEVRACDFGHWGDGGTHLNLVWAPGAVADEVALKEALQSEIYAICVREFDGSFSAEHGLGPHNGHHHRRLSAAHRFEIEELLSGHFDPEGRHRN